MAISQLHLRWVLQLNLVFLIKYIKLENTFFNSYEKREAVHSFFLFCKRGMDYSLHYYEGGSESSVIGVITLLIDIIGCCIMP